MFLNGIEYPNQILDAIKSNSLVVFAGAGASIGAPTNLPNFNDMCDQIADGSHFERAEGVACEVFLGTLKANDIKVNEIAAEILSDSCKSHLIKELKDLSTEEQTNLNEAMLKQNIQL
ncbi:MAG: hypothetical protein IKI61_06635 [Erysipelotrichaceae bacterium]|nr:hypothetical protein [Erysipelotrichaceae bacterium]